MQSDCKEPTLLRVNHRLDLGTNNNAGKLLLAVANTYNLRLLAKQAEKVAAGCLVVFGIHAELLGLVGGVKVVDELVLGQLAVSRLKSVRVDWSHAFGPSLERNDLESAVLDARSLDADDVNVEASDVFERCNLITRVLLLKNDLRRRLKQIREELIDFKKLDKRLRVAGVLAFNTLSDILLESALTQVDRCLRHESLEVLFLRERWETWDLQQSHFVLQF